MSNERLDPQRQYVIGTAGHIDHGKTALVKALTGVDTDRLPEEKARGITINLGFAHLSENVTIIDVPGHERLIKNMVAGVSTIDLVLFVVAADDGVMPQTREHLDIVNLLQIHHGIFVITKIDLVDEEWLQLVEDEIRSLLEHTPLKQSPILRTSTLTGEGIEEVRQTLLSTLQQIPPRQDLEVFRMPIDRVFSSHGFGTVVTGTVLSGKLKVGDAVEIQPAGISTRVRGLQTHEHEVVEVKVGFRAAVNLAGVEVSEIERGMVLAQPNLYQPVHRMNVSMSLLPSSPIPLKNNQRVRVHLHTVETFARVIIPHAPLMNPGESGYVQFRLEEPVHAAYQDRFIIRQYSPQRTIGGGVVLQVNPSPYRKRFFSEIRKTLQRLESDNPQDKILGAFDVRTAKPLSLWQIKTATNIALQELQQSIKQMVAAGELLADSVSGKAVYFSQEQIEHVLERIETHLTLYHQQYPGRSGLGEVELVSRLEKLFPGEAIRKALQVGVQKKRLILERKNYRLSTFTPALSGRDSEVYTQLEALYREARFAPPTVKEVMSQLNISQKNFKELIKLLREDGKLIYVDENLYYHASAIEEIKTLLKEHFQQKEGISVAEFKELTGTTRKHSIPLLEYLDRNGFTRREGDLRKVGENLQTS
ncbi:MAG: selenocysteine-specific translation elongation factor [Calditrichaeota bacterium]|nr:MAG: selenocysteine-specific translation elongation factor [Calditrichota bacterium]